MMLIAFSEVLIVTAASKLLKIPANVKKCCSCRQYSPHLLQRLLLIGYRDMVEHHGRKNAIKGCVGIVIRKAI
jgi:hypothetical protein